MRSVFTGATMPAVIRRLVASPENEPPSYSPDCMSETPLFGVGHLLRVDLAAGLLLERE
jgi:hypothetical protein